MGPGARALLPRRQGCEVRGPGRDGRSIRVQQGAEAGWAGRSHLRQGTLGVCRAGTLATAAGGDERGVRADGESGESGEGADRSMRSTPNLQLSNSQREPFDRAAQKSYERAGRRDSQPLVRTASLGSWK